MNARTRAAALVVLAAVGAGATGGQDKAKPPGLPDEAVGRAKKHVEDRLAELKARRAVVVPIWPEALTRTFPDRTFVSVRFPLWPVAVAPPAPLKSQNLFAVGKDGKLQHLADAKGLEDYFRAHLPPVKGPQQAADAADSWAHLAQEFVQDGFYIFRVKSPSSIEAAPGGGIKSVEARAVVEPAQGNKGELRATLHFDQAGKLTKVAQENKVVRGIRPRCQTTLLLHPDPVVRAVAEDSLLVLGRAARPYLDEQRAAAGPELRAAIDRIWQRIVAEGR